MSKQDFLLPEDVLLLNKFKDIGELSSGTALENNKREMIIIQTEATLRNRKTMVDLDKSNKTFSITIMGLTFIQIALAMFDSVFQITTYENKAKGYVYLVIFFITMFYIARMIYKDLKNNAN